MIVSCLFIGLLNEHSEGQMVNGKRVGFSPTNEKETAQETLIQEQEQFGTVGSRKCDIKREIVSNLQPLKQ